MKIRRTSLLPFIAMLTLLVSAPVWAADAGVPPPLLTGAQTSSSSNDEVAQGMQAVDISTTAEDANNTAATEEATPNQLRVSTMQDNTNDEHLIWNKQPLSVMLPINKERMVSFSEAVELINTNPDLTGEKLTVMINAGTLYLTAHQAFSPIRVSVRLKNSGQLVLLDLSAAGQADDTPIDVVISDVNLTSSAPSAPAFQTTDIDLLRFAISTLYAPERLVSLPDGITRTAMYTQKSVMLFYDETTLDYSLASWRDAHHFVTAITVQNTQKTSRTLDPRHLHGSWLAAVFYPTNHLKPQGQTGDTTTLFLISAAPFGQAIAHLQGAQG